MPDRRAWWARDRLELIRAENLSVSAAFNLSYDDLTAGQQRLFRRLGLHPGTDIDAYAAAALGDITLDEARRELEALYDQHLLTEPARGRYHMHDLVAEHARHLAGTDPADDADQAVSRLLGYYLHAAHAASRYLPRRPPAGLPPLAGSPPAYAPELSARRDAAALMEAECLNLHAATGLAAARGMTLHACGIAAAMHGFLRAQSYWDQALSMHKTALDAALLAGDQATEARARSDLADTQYLLCSYRQALENFTVALRLYRELGDVLGQASAMSTLGIVQDETGDYAGSAASAEQALELNISLTGAKVKLPAPCQVPVPGRQVSSGSQPTRPGQATVPMAEF